MSTDFDVIIEVIRKRLGALIASRKTGQVIITINLSQGGIGDTTVGFIDKIK